MEMEVSMALVRCGECGKEVSERAAQCPHCGNPIAAAQTPPAPPRPVENTGSVKRWSTRTLMSIGAALGALASGIQAMGAPDAPSDIGGVVATALGGAVGGALIFMIIAAVRNAVVKAS